MDYGGKISLFTLKRSFEETKKVNKEAFDAGGTEQLWHKTLCVILINSEKEIQYFY